MSSTGIISGYADGTFRPGNLITRAEATVIITKLEGFSEQFNTDQTFSDLPEDHWAYAYMMYAANGYKENE